MDTQTDVRAIPEDWDCARICDAAAPTTNAIVGGPFGSDLVSSDYETSGTPVIRGKNMSESVVCGEFVFVSPRKAKSLTANLARPRDLIFTQRGTLGQVSLVPDGAFENYLISQSQMKVTLDQSRHDPAFVRQYFASSEGQKQILNSAIQTGVPHTNLGILRGYQFPAPSLSEQRAIAEVLSDVDESLGALEALIAKKRAIRHAAMQQLLTGKTRLPAFSGPWEVKSIDAIVMRSTGIWGKDEPDERHSLRTEIIRAGDISGDGRLTATATRFVSPAEYEKAKCDLDNLLITTSGTGLGKLWWCDGRKGTAASNFVRILRPDATKVVGRYLFYALRTEEGLRQLLAHTATSAYPNLLPTYFATAWVSVPSTPEQIAIASVLTDMDAEIAALEARRDKTRSIKQGMVQQLLSGHVRLIKPASAEASA